MLGKLTRYELKANARYLVFLYLAVAVLIAGSWLMSFGGHPLRLILAYVLMMLAGFGTLVVTNLVIFMRGYKGIFGREGYLTMTLPVDMKPLYWSRIINGLVWTIFAMVILLYCALQGMVFLHRAQSVDMAGFWQELLEAFPMPALAVLLVYCVLAQVAFIAEVFFCMAISTVKPFHSLGIGAGIIAYLALAAIEQVYTFTTMLFVPLSFHYHPDAGWSMGTTTMWSYFSSINWTQTGTSDEMVMGAMPLLLPVIMLVVFPMITLRLMRRKVNLR